jgi:hypothetical protein
MSFPKFPEKDGNDVRAIPVSPSEGETNTMLGLTIVAAYAAVVLAAHAIHAAARAAAARAVR